MHVIYGPNESGKSTTLRAITGWLYDIDRKTTDSYLHRAPDLRVGGKLRSADGKELECIRRKGNRNTLLDPKGGNLDEALLAPFLNGVTQETFERQFGLTHSRLVEGGRAISQGDGDLGEILFAAGAGLGRLSVIQKKLLDDMEALFTPRGSTRVINKQLSDLNTLRKSLRESLLKPAEYKRRAEEFERVQAETQRLTEEVQRRKRELERSRNWLQALPIIAQRTLFSNARQALPAVPRLDEAFVERRRASDTKRTIAKQQLDQIKQRASKLSAEIAQLPQAELDDRHRQAIQDAHAQRSAVHKAMIDLKRLKQEALTIRNEIEDRLMQIDQDKHFDDLDSLQISGERREKIQALASCFGVIEERALAAQQKLQDLKQQEQEAVSQAARSEPPADPETLEVLLERIGQPQVLIDQWNDAKKRLATLRKRGDREVKRLHGFQGSLEQAMQLHPPPQAKIDAAATALATRQSTERGAADELKKAIAEFERCREQLERLKREQDIPSEAELSVVRAERDEQIGQLSSGEVASAAQLVELTRLTMEADRLVDRLRREAERVAQRVTAEVQQQSLQEKIEAIKERQHDAAEQCEEAWQDWQELWRTAGILADQPEVMSDWMQGFEQLNRLHDDLREAEHAELSAEQRIAEVRQWLRSELRLQPSVAQVSSDADDRPLIDTLEDELEDQWGNDDSLFKQEDSDAMDECFGDPEETGESLANSHEHDVLWLYTQARSRLTKMRARFAEYQQTLADQARLRDQLPGSEETAKLRNQELADWQTAWGIAIEGLALSDATNPDGMLRLIQQIDQMFARNTELNSVTRRIESMEQEIQAFNESVTQWLADAAPDLATADPIHAIPELNQRLSDQNVTEQKRTSLLKQQAELHEQMQANENDLKAAEAALGLLAKEAQCDDLERLPEVERLSAQHVQLEQKIENQNAQLALLAGGIELEMFVEQAEAVDAESLQTEVDQEAADLVQEEQRLKEKTLNLGELKRDVESMDGSGAAAALQQQIQDSLARIRRDAVRYATLRVADVALRKAIEQYRDANQGPILSLAEKFFSRLTLGDYTGLQVNYGDRDQPELVGVRDETTLPVTAMSDGAADALYLAIRLASLETHIERQGPFPFIVDDILIQLDDDRAGAALQILSELSEKTQIIFFTHHQHLLEIADEKLQPSDYHVHRL